MRHVIAEDTVRFQRRTGLSADDLATLAETPLFHGMTAENMRALLSEASVRRYTKGTILFIQGDAATRFYMMLDGWVKLFRETPDGHEAVISVFTRGESFAEAASFADGAFPVSAEVVDESRILVVPAAHFAAKLREDGALALNMLGSMSYHLRSLVQQVEQRTVKSSTERLGTFLLRLCNEDTGRATLNLPTEKSLIAARLGMQPETLSRSLAKLRKLGIETRDREIVIPDVAQFKRQMADGDDF